MTDSSGQDNGTGRPDQPEMPVAGQPSPSLPLQESYVLVIGDVGVTPHWVVTPNGSAPLRSAQWVVRDLSRTEERIPAYAIVLAVIFAFACLLGLLFLLIKERHIVGYVEVSVQAEGLYHVVQFPVAGPATLAWVHAQVNQARSMAAQLG